jgi:hypothetical protein
VVLTLFRFFRLHILFSNIDPVTHATLHDPLNEHQLLLGSPIFRKEREIKIVENIIVVLLLVIALLLTSPVTFETHCHGWAAAF